MPVNCNPGGDVSHQYTMNACASITWNCAKHLHHHVQQVCLCNEQAAWKAWQGIGAWQLASYYLVMECHDAGFTLVSGGDTCVC